MALVADHHGEVVVAPFVSALSGPRVQQLLSAVEKPRRERRPEVYRAGVEAAGHCHRARVTRLGGAGIGASRSRTPPLGMRPVPSRYAGRLVARRVLANKAAHPDHQSG
jgi:hypothetical protein